MKDQFFFSLLLEADFSAVQRKQFFDTFEHGIETSLLFQEVHVKYVFWAMPSTLTFLRKYHFARK